ncbi:hypothetical protein [Nocardia sp. NPDC050175]|uniref:hypothetical protein n=1 Tax=Nocardia sp. NPDC050175 TaxID=3364317 RepID=UPI0037AFCBD4
MSIETRVFLGVLRGMLSGFAAARERACDEVTDLTAEWSAQQTGVLVAVMCWLAAEESDPDAFEAELHAVSELVENREVERRDFQGVLAVDRNKLSGSTVEYFDYLVSMLEG